MGLVLFGAVVSVTLIRFRHALWPQQLTTTERLQQFPMADLPLERPVTVRWNSYQVPFIEAATDGDLAFVLGMVHAHLRGGQIELLQRIAQGRLSEMAGPLAVDIDAALRTLDFGRAANEIVMAMDPETRRWLDRFVAGYNLYWQRAERQPPELALLGIRHEPLTPERVITFARLAGTDVNWLSMFALLRERLSPSWPEVWERALHISETAQPSFTAGAPLTELLRGLSRSGSNSIAVSGARTPSGAPIVANDPHLGTSLPNFWLLAGYRSPTYECVGMMVPGVPFMAIGRSPDLAWGGTNMRTASSDLYDVSFLPRDQISSKRVRIGVRWFPDREIEVRSSPFGPILSDRKLIAARDGEELALRWVGHQASDELAAFLRANRARTVSEFVEAFRGYAVSGQNMVAVDRDGRIVMTLATRLPIRHYAELPELVLDPSDARYAWHGYLEGPDLPVLLDPAEGYIASANNPPTAHNPPIGFLFGHSERYERLTELLAEGPIDRDRVAAIQRDTVSPAARRLNDRWLQDIRRLELAESAGELMTLLTGWDGSYRAEERAPVAFEAFTTAVLDRVYPEERQTRTTRHWSSVSQFLADDLAALDAPRQRAIVAEAIELARGALDQFSTWGDMHRQKARHLLGGVPLLGSRFTFGDFPAAGSRETVLKTDHPVTADRSGTRYGSQSRHISSMDDPDHNWFVLFGGQDGWLGSANMTDQIGLWFAGEYVQLPLRPQSVARQFRNVMELEAVGADRAP